MEAVTCCAKAGAHVDIVLSDMIMPRMSGYELAVQLRALVPGMRVLLMSGYTKDAAVRRDPTADVDGFIEKPFTSAGLAAKVRQVLDAPSGSRLSNDGTG